VIDKILKVSYLADPMLEKSQHEIPIGVAKDPPNIEIKNQSDSNVV